VGLLYISQLDNENVYPKSMPIRIIGGPDNQRPDNQRPYNQRPDNQRPDKWSSTVL